MFLLRLHRAPPPCPPAFRVPRDILEYFDGVTPPALPPDWVAKMHKVRRRYGSLLISACLCRLLIHPPNAAFIDDPAVVSDKRLDSANVAIFEGFISWVRFRHNFNLEASDWIPTSASMAACWRSAPMAEIHFNTSCLGELRHGWV